jgi:hypothetical protein
VGATWWLFVAVVLAVTGLVRVAAPDWLSGETRELPDRPLLIVDIFVNNLLIALLPLLGGWLAAGYSVARRRVLAGLFLLGPALIVGRSLVTIGAVGGADPGWLAGAARWWSLELAALAASSSAGAWLVRHSQVRDTAGKAVMRGALIVVVFALAVAAAVEVLTA